MPSYKQAMQSFRDIIALWPSPEALAADIGEKPWTVHKWRTRDSIPADRWQRLLDAGAVRGLTFAAEDLARIAARPAEDAA